MRIISLSILLLISSFLFSYCSDENEIITPPPITQKENYVCLSDTSAKIGEKIFAYSNIFKEYRSINIYLDSLYVESKIVEDTILALFIPYNAKKGKFKFYLNYSSTLSDTLLYSQDFYLSEECSENVCINWNSKEEILESDSWWYDFNSDTIKWTIETHSDSIFFKRNGICGDECSYLHTIVFKDNSINQLPTFLFAVRKVNLWLEPDVNDTIRNCNIVVDKWNSNLYSGTFSFDDFTWIFFVNN
jgi:hypothetical protein